MASVGRTPKGKSKALVGNVVSSPKEVGNGKLCPMVVTEPHEEGNQKLCPMVVSEPHPDGE